MRGGRLSNGADNPEPLERQKDKRQLIMTRTVGQTVPRRGATPSLLLPTGRIQPVGVCCGAHRPPY